MNTKRLAKLCSLVCIIPVLWGCEEEQVVKSEVIRPVKVIEISDSTSFIERSFSGRAKAAVEVDLAFRISGPIIDFPVDVGTKVRSGDLLAQIDPAPFRADVERYKADVRSAIAELTNAEQDLDRAQKLYKNNHVSKARVDKSQAAYGVTKAQVGAAQAALDRVRLDLNYTKLVAPFEGVVVSTYVDNFQDVSAKQAILRIVDSSQIEMIIDIPESLISRVPEVENIAVFFDAFPDTAISASVKEIGTEASQTTRTFPVTLSMMQPDGIEILPGMAGKASGQAGKGTEVEGANIQAPVSAVYTDVETGKQSVWIVNKETNTVIKQAVETGNLTDFGIEITKGLSVGDLLVTAGVNSLAENQKVRIIK